jgi:Domain of unknown function (DUF4148)
MNVSKLIAALALPVALGTAAWANEDSALGLPAPTSNLSRAEVLADLQIWRDAGLAELQDGEQSAVGTPRHDAALARYATLRSSPDFAALVQRIALQRGEKVLIAATK